MSKDQAKLYPQRWKFNEFGKFGKSPEPRSLQDKLFLPINASIIQFLFRVLILKYVLIIPALLFENVIDSILRFYSLSTVIDFTLITLLMVTYNWNREASSQIQAILGYSLLIVSLFMIGQILYFSFFSPSTTLIASILILNGIEFSIFYIMKDRLVKSTDADKEIYDLDSTTKNVLIGFFLVFMVVYLIPTIPRVDEWEFFALFTLMLLGYIVFIDLWIAGPNEFMDRESMHHLTRYTLYIIILITLTGLFFYNQEMYEFPIYFIFIANPILFLNLFSKYNSYVFRLEKHIQVATMIVDNEIIAK